jgi:hypothetical protein
MTTNRFGTRRATMVWLLISAVVIYGGRLLANPAFSDDFTATFTSLDLGAPWSTNGLNKSQGRLNFGLAYPGIDSAQSGTMYIDHSGQKAKYSLASGIDIFDFYNEPRRYVVSTDTGACSSYPLNGEMPSFFGLLATDAVLLSVLDPSGAELWEYQINHANLIEWGIATDRKTPFFILWQMPRSTAWLKLHTYQPGKPASSTFTLPAGCV